MILHYPAYFLQRPSNDIRVFLVDMNELLNPQAAHVRFRKGQWSFDESYVPAPGLVCILVAQRGQIKYVIKYFDIDINTFKIACLQVVPDSDRLTDALRALPC